MGKHGRDWKSLWTTAFFPKLPVPGKLWVHSRPVKQIHRLLTLHLDGSFMISEIWKFWKIMEIMYAWLEPWNVSGKWSMKRPTARTPINLSLCTSQKCDTRIVPASFQFTVTQLGPDQSRVKTWFRREQECHLG
jgi:hypothetical protein